MITFKLKESFTCFFLNSNTERSFPDKESAMKAAREYCGNNSYTKLFPNDRSGEESYIFGPGDGTTSVMVRQDVEWVEECKK